jgi:hypothetical protein
VPEANLLALLRSVADKTPPLCRSDEGFLFVRLPILSMALQSYDATSMEDVYAKACDGDGSTQAILQGLTEFILNEKNVPCSKAAASTCVYALIKNGFNRNLDCPVVPLASRVLESILAASSSKDLYGMKAGINYLSLLVRMFNTLLCLFRAHCDFVMLIVFICQRLL